MNTPKRGLTLIELLIAVVVIGVLAVVSAVNYTHTAAQARDREAASYLQALRQAALAYHETWNAYPTLLAQVPAVMVPRPADQTSRWIYGFTLSDTTQWTTPAAQSKTNTRRLEIAQDGTITVIP